jgi:septum formation protein
MNDSTHVPRIILASASPRRHELLAAMGLAFDVAAADIDETPHPDEPAMALARRLSQAKAQALAKQHPAALVIAADTLVVVDNEILGKPADKAEARDMLARLRGREHVVYSGLTVMDGQRDRGCHQVAMTPVVMREYGQDELERYVDSGDPMDKAGGYAIQHEGFVPVDHVDDCYANVIGLPMCHLYRALAHWQVAVPVHPLRSCPLPQAWGYCPWAQAILEAPPETYCLS